MEENEKKSILRDCLAGFVIAGLPMLLLAQAVDFRSLPFTGAVERLAAATWGRQFLLSANVKMGTALIVAVCAAGYLAYTAAHGTLRVSFAGAAFGIWTFYAGLTAFSDPLRPLAAHQFTVLLAGLCIFMACEGIFSGGKKRWLEPAAVLAVTGGVLLACHGIWEHEEFGRMTAAFGNKNFLGEALAALLVVAAGLFLHFLRRRSYLCSAAIAAAAVIAVALNLTAARGAAIGALAGIAFIVFLASGSKARRAFFYGLSGPAIVGAVLFLSCVPLREAVFSLTDRGTLMVRKHVYAAAADAVFDAPLFGHGTGRTLFALAPHLSSERCNDPAEALGRNVFSAHSLPLDVLIEHGLTGLVLLAAFLAFFFARVLKRDPDDKRPTDFVAAGFAGGTVALLTAALPGRFFDQPNMILFFFFAGIASGAYTPDTRPGPRLRHFHGGALPGVAMALMVSWYMLTYSFGREVLWGIPVWHANRQSADFLARLADGYDHRDLEHRRAGIVKLYELGLKYSVNHPIAVGQYVNFYCSIGAQRLRAIDGGLDDFERLIRRAEGLYPDRRHVTRAALAEIFYARGETRPAVEFMIEAANENPYFPAYPAWIADALLGESDYPAAHYWLMRLRRLQPGSFNTVEKLAGVCYLQGHRRAAARWLAEAHKLVSKADLSERVRREKMDEIAAKMRALGAIRRENE